jgi:N-acetylglucosamine-6-phosphate deacetylase
MTVTLAGRLILPDRIVGGSLQIADGRIAAIHPGPLTGPYLAPGFVDLHVHGGAGADFMDGTTEAFTTVCRAHARHGTTALLATSTVGTQEQILRFLEVCRAMRNHPTGGARVCGAHLYGPYFAEQARGCHPAAPVRPPLETEYEQYLTYADVMRTASVAPELPGAEAFARACVARGIRLHLGHSHATWPQVEAAIGWGARHVDHLFCAMSDRARLRQTQSYPMRGGLLEATLYFDQLTTEVIADGKHLAPELLRLAYKIKGPDRLALVSDANRALDMPDGEYVFGPREGGQWIVHRDGVGLMPDGAALASGVMGLDHAVRTMRQASDAPLPELIRMASLTPARLAGLQAERGSLEVGKRADILVLDEQLQLREVWLAGERLLA